MGESNQGNLKALIEGATSLFQRLQKGTINVHGKPMPINGAVALLFRADGTDALGRRRERDPEVISQHHEVHLGV